MSYQLNPSATSNMPGEIVQVKIPNDDDYIVCVGSDGVPFVSSKNAISGGSSAQTLFELLRDDPNTLELFYPEYTSFGTVRKIEVARVAGGPAVALQADGVHWLVDGYIIPTPDDDIAITPFSETSKRYATGRMRRGTVVAIIYYDGSGATTCYFGDQTVGFSMQTTVNSEIKFTSYSSSNTAFSYAPISSLVTGYNILCANIWSDADSASSEYNNLYREIYVNGVLKATGVQSMRGYPEGAPNALFSVKNSTHSASAVLLLHASGNLTSTEQLDILNQFKSDHGIA